MLIDKTLLIDGFPKTLEQAKLFEEQTEKQIENLIVFDCNQETLQRRASQKDNNEILNKRISVLK